MYVGPKVELFHGLAALRHKYLDAFLFGAGAAAVLATLPTLRERATRFTESLNLSLDNSTRLLDLLQLLHLSFTGLNFVHKIRQFVQLLLGRRNCRVLFSQIDVS